jgi:hypothetical protein
MLKVDRGLMTIEGSQSVLKTEVTFLIDNLILHGVFRGFEELFNEVSEGRQLLSLLNSGMDYEEALEVLRQNESD